MHASPPSQDLTDASYTRENGASVLSFTVSQSYLTQYANGGSAVIFLYAYGSGASDFGYHGIRRGLVSIPDFVESSGDASELPSSGAQVEFQPIAGTRLSMNLDEAKSKVTVELLVAKEVSFRQS